MQKLLRAWGDAADGCHRPEAASRATAIASTSGPSVRSQGQPDDQRHRLQPGRRTRGNRTGLHIRVPCRASSTSGLTRDRGLDW